MVVERLQVLTSIQRALLGEVFPSLRMITAEWAENRLQFFAYIDGEPREEDKESLSVIFTEVVASFDADTQVNYIIIQIDAPNKIEDSRLRLFQRRETT